LLRRFRERSVYGHTRCCKQFVDLCDVLRAFLAVDVFIGGVSAASVVHEGPAFQPVTDGECVSCLGAAITGMELVLAAAVLPIGVAGTVVGRVAAPSAPRAVSPSVGVLAIRTNVHWDFPLLRNLVMRTSSRFRRAVVPNCITQRRCAILNEPPPGIEPGTSILPKSCSTTELRRRQMRLWNSKGPRGDSNSCAAT
jgi:hypothetical protein